MAKKAVILLADGFEEIEAMAPFDILKRAGIEVTLAGLSALEVKTAHGAKVIADSKLDDLKADFDAVILPGGGLGAENLSKSEKVKKLLKKMHFKGKLIAAICASPAYVLAPAGILSGKKATCYPSCKEMLPGDVSFSDEAVVVDGNILTSKGPGTAIAFGTKLAEILAGKRVADSIKTKMLLAG